jgi:serine protease DegQ
VAPSIGTRPVQSSYADGAQKAMPAVVNVFSSKDGSLPPDPRAKDPLFRYFFGDKNKRKSDEPPASNLGSGVIVSSEGYILTNQHVVDGADQIEVALADGRTSSAKVIGVDPETDLAVLKINMTNLPTITLGRMDQTRVGDVVLAIGNPFGVGQTVTMGIVSALGRNHLGINTFENFIQTDAAINPGNSGGALIDVNGNLLGINTAIYSRSGGSLGIGFAIPVSTARSVLESIITTGTVTRGWIGVEPQDVTPEIAESFGLDQKSGAIVAGVLQGGPADKAGIKPGDILVSINDDTITDTTRLLNVVAQIKPGTSVKVHLMRKNKELDVNVMIGKRPAQPRAPQLPEDGQDDQSQGDE